MKKYLPIWLLFGVFVVAVLASMGWLSNKLITLQKANIRVQQEAVFEESVRLALWRMDAEISPMILEESSRPYYDYWAYNYQGQNVENEEINGSGVITAGNVSPLLARPNDDDVNIYFQAELSDGDRLSDAKIQSPQVLSSVSSLSLAQADANGLMDNRIQLDELKKNINAADLRKALKLVDSNKELNDVDDYSDSEEEDESGDELIASEKQSADYYYRENVSAPANMPVSQPDVQQLAQVDKSGYLQRRSKSEQSKRNVQKTKSRLYDEIAMANTLPQTVSPVIKQSEKDELKEQVSEKVDKGQVLDWSMGSIKSAAEIPAEVSTGKPIADISELGNRVREDQTVSKGLKVKEDIMHPVWVNDLLILARNVQIDGKSNVQGVWLNWDNIKSQLLEEIEDLFPEADLVAADPFKEIDKSRLMAALPVKLIPGNAINLPIIPASSYRIPLAVAWVFVLVGVAAVAILLAGTSILSERRGAFVSAVTHELRTPLTTFRMYTEMLAEGMVKDEKKKDEYIQTLHKESNRLGHLVENVLAYSRLENGSVSSSLENIRIADIVERVEETLARRSEEAGMHLVVDISEEDGFAESRTSLMTVEQILFNLVDNSCKYASSAEDNRIHFAVTVEDESVIMRICDHGKGLQKKDRQIAFKPFRKSAEMAAESAPGVGLGLALCKRLTAQIGARIYYEEHKSYGACFILRLPLA